MMKRKQFLINILCALLFLNCSAQTPVCMGFEGFDSSYACNEFINQNLSVYIPHYNNFYNSYAQRKKLKAIIEIDRVKKKGEDKEYNQKDKSWSKNIWLYKNGWLTDEISIEQCSSNAKTNKSKYRTDTISKTHFDYYHNRQKIILTTSLFKIKVDDSLLHAMNQIDTFICFYFNEQNKIDSLVQSRKKTTYSYDDSGRIDRINLFENQKLKRKISFVYKNEIKSWQTAYSSIESCFNNYSELNFLNKEIQKIPFKCKKITFIDSQFSNSIKTKEQVINYWKNGDFTFVFSKEIDTKKTNNTFSIYSILFKSKKGEISNFTTIRSFTTIGNFENYYSIKNYQQKGGRFTNLEANYLSFGKSVNRSKFAKDLRKRIYNGDSKRNGIYYKLIR